VNYILKDNGLRAFIPPVFSWDVCDDTGKKLDTASELNLSDVVSSQQEEIQLLTLLSKGKLIVKGRIESLPTVNFEAGRRFTVTEIVTEVIS